MTTPADALTVRIEAHISERTKAGKQPSRSEIEMMRSWPDRLARGELHPWYGPCDGLGASGECSECQRSEASVVPADALPREGPEREAELHDLIARLWSVVDPDDVPDLLPRVHQVLGVNDPEGDCGNVICGRLQEVEASLARLREALETVAARGCVSFPRGTGTCRECDGTGLWCDPCIANEALLTSPPEGDM